MSDLFTESYALVLDELQECLARISGDQVDRMLDAIQETKRIFVVGAGRMGLVLSTFCMRLNHLGFSSYLVGAIHCPPISAEDLLIVASSSGETATIREVVRKAEKHGARIAAISATPDSTIARIATFTIRVHAPAEFLGSERDAFTSRQPMKTLFEQALFVLLESAVLMLMKKTGQTAADLAQRHANLE